MLNIKNGLTETDGLMKWGVIMSDRINIALFIANVEDQFSNDILRGAYLAADEVEANIIVIPGKYFELDRSADPRQRYEYQYNALFSYAKGNDIDIIVAGIGTIGYMVDSKRKREFLNEFEGIPIITIASKEGDFPSIMYDNYSGLHAAMEYLIQHKKCKKFGILSGYKTNEDAVERCKIVMDAIKEHGLTFEDDAVIYTEPTEYCEGEAEELIERYPDLDAIICTNDSMAIGLYRALKKKSIVPGQDIMVLGFDDIPVAKEMDPPLATVRADAVMLGYQASVDAYHKVKDNIPHHELIPSEFVPRESVGFFNTDAQAEVDFFVRQLAVLDDPIMIGNKIADYLFSDLNIDVKKQMNRNLYVEFLSNFFEITFGNSVDEETVIFLYSSFKKVVNKGNFELINVSRLKLIIETAYSRFCEHCPNLKEQMLLFRLISQMNQKFLDYKATQITEIKNKHFYANHITNILARDLLIFDNDTEQSYAELVRNLIMLEVTDSYLYIFEEPIKHRKEDKWELPENILLKAYSWNDEIHAVSRTQQRIKTADMFKIPQLCERYQRLYIVIDLYCGEMQYGILVCNIPYKFYTSVELLTYQVSAAVRTIQLFQQQKLTQKMLEESMEQLKLNNVELETAAKLDELTGVLNRRGFYRQVEHRMRDSVGQDKYYIAVYADMDNLKQINDQFGHEEGDYAIESSAKILGKAMKDIGVYGRIGGDEFAAFAIVDDAGIREVILDRIKQYTDELNDESGKPYYVNLSVGICEFPNNSDLLLKDMLDQADDLLYEAKKKKRKKVSR